MSHDLIYTPGVQILVESSYWGVIDVSEDIESGSLDLNENNLHSLSFVLANPRRKYDGVFTPNDRVTVRLKRLRWLQCMAGYLDTVPYFSTYPRSVRLSASCTMKAIKYFPWDSKTVAAFNLMHPPGEPLGSQNTVTDTITRLLTEVALWPSERIHIGRIPDQWHQKFADIYNRIRTETDTTRNALGTNPVVSGQPITGISAAYAPWSGVGQGNTALVSSEGAETWPINDSDLDIIRETIREGEAGDNYGWVKSGTSATGAYCIQDQSWNRYGGEPGMPGYRADGYARAYLAPPNIQDAYVNQRVKTIRSHYGNRLGYIPQAWYCPASINEPNDPVHGLDTKCGGESNWGTVRQYATKWLQRFPKNYQEHRGTPPPYASSTQTTGTTTTASGQTGAVGDVRYPIPSGKTRCKWQEVGWGGYSNGKIPASALRGYGSSYPLAGQAYEEMAAAAAAEGINIKPAYSYRRYEDQVWPGGGIQTAGTSIHGWGLAFDISPLVYTNKKGPYYGISNDQMYDTPMYRWLTANSWKFGFVNPPFAQRGASGAEAWHFEWVAMYSVINGTIQPGTGANPMLGGGAYTTVDSMFPGGLFPAQGQHALFSAMDYWMGNIDAEVDVQSEILYGARALMNDESISETVFNLVQVTGRRFCSGPNGDFIAWWPDLWGEYGLNGAMDIELIELQDFTVDWSDAPLVTHQFVEGAFKPIAVGPLPVGVSDPLQALLTGGIATVDLPGFIEAILSVPKNADNTYPWLSDGTALTRKFGARVRRTAVNTIYGAEQEFWYAVNLFTEAWADQFTANAPMTFMPELFPGMRMRIPAYKVQFYVKGVTHTWDLGEGGGFTTTARICAPSAMDGSGLYLFPKARQYPPYRNTPAGGRES